MSWEFSCFLRFFEHRNLCPIYKLGEYEGQPFMVMESLEADTLQEAVESAAQQQKTIPLDDVLDVAIQVAGGLEAAHKKGNHRDIKPVKIFVARHCEAKILGALTYLQRGRSEAHTGRIEASRRAYQDLLALWEDADPDIPTLKQAKAE